MGNYILKNHETILRCPNWAMEALHDSLKQVTRLEGISNPVFTDFLEKLDQNIYGRGCIYIEITSYFDHTEGKLTQELLKNVVAKAIEIIRQSGQFRQDYIDLLEDFKKKLHENKKH